MKSVKCNKCGFVGWADSDTCKKCKSLISNSVSQNTSFNQTNRKNPQKPSLTAIISNEPLVVMVGIILPIVAWGIHIAINVLGVSITSRRSGTQISADDSGWQIFLPIIFTILGIAVTLWRVSYINNLFENGIEITGNITDINFVKDRGNVEYSYSWNGNNFKGCKGIMKNSKTQALQKGQRIPLILDPQKPDESLLVELYS